MPEYGKPAGRDILEGFELRLRDLERQVSALQGRRLLSVDRGATTGVPAPVEGQVMVEETDEKLKWYSNGQWREPTATGTSVYSQQPVPKYSIRGREFEMFHQEVMRSGFSPVTDATAPFGGYYEATAQNSYFIVGAPLGPRYSRWAVNLYMGRGTDYGKINLHWATSLSDATGTGNYAQGVLEPPGTWYKQPASYEIDTYSGLYTAPWNLTEFPLFLIDGADGSLLAADAVLDEVYRFDAGGDGSVWWWLRVSNPDKHASSSGYRVRIHALEIVRVIDGGWQIF